MEDVRRPERRKTRQGEKKGEGDVKGGEVDIEEEGEVKEVWGNEDEEGEAKRGGGEKEEEGHLSIPSPRSQTRFFFIFYLPDKVPPPICLIPSNMDLYNLLPNLFCNISQKTVITH